MTVTPFATECRGPLCSQNAFHTPCLNATRSAESATETSAESGLYITNSNNARCCRRKPILQNISSQHHLHQLCLTKPPPQKKTHGFFTLISMVQVIEVPGVVAPPQGHTARGAVSGRRGWGRQAESCRTEDSSEKDLVKFHP